MGDWTAYSVDDSTADAKGAWTVKALVWCLGLVILCAGLSVSRGGYIPGPWYWWLWISVWLFGGFIVGVVGIYRAIARKMSTAGKSMTGGLHLGEKKE